MDEAEVIEQAVDVAFSLAVLGGSVLLAFVIYFIGVHTLFRLGRSDTFAQEATARCKWPARTTVVMLALLAGMPVTRLSADLTSLLNHLLLLGAIFGLGVSLMRLAVAVEVTVTSGLDLAAQNNAYARGRTTKVILLRRVATGVILILSVGAALLTFDEARSLGTSLLASAGIIGLVAGVAAQPTLGNMVAGIQLAMAEPLRLDDVVVVEGEWGNIEEVGLTYVVVRIWDRRRLVLPTSYFINTPFQNWTRHGSQVIGTIYWRLDHRTPFEELREEFTRQVEAHPLWDGDVAVLQVTDSGDRTVEVRGLVTANDSGAVWNLRCAIREGILSWLVGHHPESLPATRLLEGEDPGEGEHGQPDPEGVGQGVLYNPSPDPSTAPRPDPSRSGEWPLIDPR